MTLNRGEVQLVGIVADGGVQDHRGVPPASAPRTSRSSRSRRRCPTWRSTGSSGSSPRSGSPSRFRAHSVQKYKTPPKIREGILVYESWGKTEAKVKHGAVDIGLEISQTGGAIKSYGLTIVETVMRSQTSIYTHASVQKDPAKRELLEMFLLNLHGAMNAETR